MIYSLSNLLNGVQYMSNHCFSSKSGSTDSRNVFIIGLRKLYARDSFMRVLFVLLTYLFTCQNGSDTVKSPGIKRGLRLRIHCKSLITNPLSTEIV